jgi:hypothetical protein
MGVDSNMTDLLCMRLCSELSQVQSNPRQMHSRGRSLYRVFFYETASMKRLAAVNNESVIFLTSFQDRHVE